MPSFRLRYAALALTVSASVLATLTIHLGGLSSVAAHILAALTTSALGIPVLVQSAITPEKIQACMRARSIATVIAALAAHSATPRYPRRTAGSTTNSSRSS